MSLTNQQLLAATAPSDVCVTAGAGTGKTHMLSYRYLHHLSNGLSPLEIVAVTFTNQAAVQLRSRIRQIVAKEAPERSDWQAELEASQISTIHSLAERICREHPQEAGVPADFSILEEWEAKLWLSDQLIIELNKLSPEVYEQFPYSWLIKTMETLLGDPLTALEALQVQPNYSSIFAKFREQALAILVNDPLWMQAREFLKINKAKKTDKIEEVRLACLESMNLIVNGRNIQQSLSEISNLKLTSGSKNNWESEATFKEVKSQLKNVRDLVKGNIKYITLELSELDQQIFKKLPQLKDVFTQIQSQLSQIKFQQRVLDFTDLEVHALMALENINVQQYYQKRWKAFLVDEFQDINPAQSKLLKYFIQEATFTLVGDEKQSIYGFRRADIGIFKQWRYEIKNSLSLSTSFRTHQPLINNINKLFEPVLEELHQPLDAIQQNAPHIGPHLEIFLISDEDELESEYRKQIEAEHIADLVQKLLDEQILIWDKETGQKRPLEPKDIAILSSKWEPLLDYEQAISGRSIPAIQSKGGNLLDSRESKDAQAMLNFLADTNDELSLIAVLRSPFFSVSDRILYELSRSITKGLWWQTLENKEYPTILRQSIKILKTLLSKRDFEPPSRLLQYADRLTGYSAVIANLPYNQRRIADWYGFLNLIRSLEGGMANVFNVVRRLKRIVANELKLERPLLEVGNAVTMMSIHASKGLEWPIVIVPNLSAKSANSNTNTLFFDSQMGISWTFPDEEGNKQDPPALLTLLKQQQLERENAEAKRLLYVALTRSRDRLILTAQNEKGSGLDLLKVGIEGNFAIQSIKYDLNNLSLPPLQDPLIPSLENLALLLNRVESSLHLPVTALTEYSRCPKRFKYRYIDGHPGITSGTNSYATEVGVLTHKALERQIKEVEKLSPYAKDIPIEKVEEALALANKFRNSSIYSSVQNGEWEVDLEFQQKMIFLKGKGDLVGDDFVLDIKTEQEFDPEEHRFQLWAYAKSTSKPKAYIAYLRQGLLHSFSNKDLENITQEADRLITAIEQRVFEPTPSAKSCKYCPYASICSELLID